MSIGQGEICDKIDGELFKQKSGGGLDRIKWGSDWVSADLILLADCTSGYKTVDKGGKARPPEIPLNDCLCTKASEMSCEM
jgi:hypothetical protein